MRLAAALLAFLLLPVGCSRSDDDAKTVLYARGDQTDTLDPPATQWGSSAKIMNNVFEQLVTFAPDGVEIVPGLAEKWTTSPDGLTWAFALREGVKFHDGTALDAAAVVFSFERLVRDGPHTPKSVPYRENYPIESVQATDARTVTFKLQRPSAVFLPNLAMFPAGIVSPTSVKKRGAAEFARTPVGTGPMMFKTWDPGVKITLVRNPDYWGEKAKIERLIILDVRDVQTAIQRLKKGEVHVVDHITLADVPAIEADPALHMAYEVPMNVCYLAFNMKKPPYNDPNFRKAVAHAINRSKLIEIAYHGRAEAARAIVPPTIFKAPADLETCEYDPQKAKEYLAKAPPESREITLWHMTYQRPYVQEPDKVAQVIQDDLSRIGITVKLEGFNVDSYSNRIHDVEHPIVLIGWSADIADPDNFLYTLLHGDAMGDRARPTGNNLSFFDHPKYNELTSAAQATTDAARRAANYAEALKILAAEVPVIPLVHVRQMAACSKKVRYDHHPIEYRLWKIHFAP